MKRLYILLIFSLLIITACGSSKSQNKNKIATTKNITSKTTTLETDTSDLQAYTSTETTKATESDTTPDTAVVETTAPIETTNNTTTTPPVTTPKPVITTPVQTTTPAPEPVIPQPDTNIQIPKYLVDYQSDSSSTTSDYKYGIKKITTTTNYYNIYSDGSKELINTETTHSYDQTGYNASDSAILNESNSTASNNMSYYNEVLKLVNQIRAAANVKPLTLDTTLCQAATMRSLEMEYSGLFSHTRPNGKDCYSVLDTYSVSWGSVGENIAAGQRTPAEVVESWKNSPGHYANMINASYTKLGVGMSNLKIDIYGIYWTQLFTG